MQKNRRRSAGRKFDFKPAIRPSPYWACERLRIKLETVPLGAHAVGGHNALRNGATHRRSRKNGRGVCRFFLYCTPIRVGVLNSRWDGLITAYGEQGWK